ncbi:polyketide synthase [Amycolatopsis sp.]|uniref:polyketide synthase n=1 Tax=Amycolatopsis sp. TaxID=37632 RepID=UPI002E076B79|nr:polyketide synthase [Amycolatopsis sp.]HEV7975506.1 beta-ketoacyl synthase N-terminal-like domain-containing protein [Amycolatopsis sp.]
MTAEELTRWLVEQVAEICELDQAEIDPRLPLDDYGFSSRDAVELSGGLEDLLERSLPATLLWEHPTIEQLASALTSENTEAPAAEVHTSTEDPIAIVGLGCRLPGGVNGPEQFWRLLSEGLEAVSEVTPDRWAEYAGVPAETTRWGGFLDDIAGFDAEFFGIAPREAARMDPQQRLMLEVAWEALEHAGIAPASLRGSRTGVFVGISGTEYGALSLADVAGVDAWVGTGAALAIAANRLSYALDLRGPSMSVDTACSSSLTAVHLAVQSLRSGESDLAVVGGVNLLLGPAVTANFDQMGISSANGRCKPFSADADGIARAEGAGVVVLKRLSEARADGDRVLALVRGSATNSDGRSNGLTAPNPEAQQALLRTAYGQAGIDPATVDYVEAHGTGTLLGDPIEAGALGAVLGAGRSSEKPLLLGSVKSNLGHLEAAAGIVGLIKVVLSFVHQRIPASLNYAAPNRHIDFDALRLSVVDTARSWPSRDTPALAGVSGFGFGGTNAHIIVEQAILEQAPGEVPAKSPGRYRRFLLGAPDSGRLQESAGQLATWLWHHGPDLAGVEWTLSRKLSGRHRAAVAARDLDELVAGLRSLSLGEESPSTVSGSPLTDENGPVFVFSGHGSQWAGMGRRLMADEPVFAAAIRRLDPVIRRESGFSLREDLLLGIDAVTMDHVQPLVFGIQVALAELWRSYGVVPAAVVGHSFGEVAAAVVAGALTEAEGAMVVALRSRLLASLAGDGAMALLELGAEEAGELVDGLSDVDIAVLSAPNQTVVAGRAESVRRIVSEVDARGLLAKLIKLDVAAHSPIVDSVTATLADGLTELRPNAASIAFYSTALAEPRSRPEFDAAYWAANLRQPVRFAGAVAAALADGYRQFVELSPHPVLRHALTDNAVAQGHPAALVLSTLRQSDNETMHFHTQLAALELTRDAGPVRREGTLVDLPTTPWRHVRHWLPRAVPIAPGQSTLLGTHIALPEDGKHVWHTESGRPGSAYPEMAGAAARTAFDVMAEQVTLHSLVLHEPLDETRPVTSTLSPIGPGKARFTVHVKTAGGSWRLQAAAELVVTEAKPRAPLTESPEWTGVDMLRALPMSSARSMVAGQLCARIASVLGFAPGQLDTEAPLTALGVDSLLAVRVRNAVEHDFGVMLPVSLLLQGASVTETEDWLCAELGIRDEPVRLRLVPKLIGPRDAAERLVTHAWTDVLGSDVGVTQDFYALGGDNEQAERVTALLAERSGREFSTAELFEFPTIERMAGHVREDDTNGSPLRVLRANGTQPPLFFFHPAGGDTAVYRQLGELLDPAVPLYGLDRREGPSSVEDKVRQYLPELRSVQSHGPYRLAGWSYGGHLAFETAQQLRRAGEDVEVVVLIDAIIPLPNLTGLPDEELNAKRFKHFGEFLEASYGRKLDLPFERMARLGDEEQVQLLVDTIRSSGLINTAVSEAILHHQRTSFLDTRSLERYRPESYDGRVVLFSAAEPIPGGLKDERFDRSDPARGWDAVCPELDVVTVPGHHLSLLDPPNVDHIAGHLGGLLRSRRLVELVR